MSPLSEASLLARRCQGFARSRLWISTRLPTVRRHDHRDDFPSIPAIGTEISINVDQGATKGILRPPCQKPVCASIGIARPPEIRQRGGVQTSAAIVIRLTRLTETSLIVHWFTEAHGLVKTVAKGAKRPKSPFAGQLDLFFGGEITLTRSRRGELHALREVAIRDWREGLRRNYTSTLLAAYCCQLLESAVEPEHPDPALHDLLRRALDHLDAAPPTLKALHHFEAELARLLGVSHHPSRAEAALRDALGTLPATRDDLIERLCPGGDFS